MSSTTNKSLDPYTEKAENNTHSPQEKIEGLHEIIKAAGSGMLVTRAADGHLHSRAMAPAGPHGASQVNLIFIANNSSHKFEEIQHDSHVNVSFYDVKTTNWASYAGTARITQDKDLIKKHWSSIISGYFGDLGDGIHKGNEHDPRVSIIEVIPEEIRYWVATSGAVGRTLQVAVGAATGKGAAPGELRTITKEEIQLTQGLLSKA
ncbi:hypothetical protein JAAARDRAFT_47435 [Jaapia argillacea MUCL 33604]|uniref:General stress protein FMN-binding split barrel domain-containing protein n=1 Tax=Jaapia argillacea MUCL 33604 TaxID=933084 RepID=A0A067PUE0_9AGAM|nr:hypothetical protein JAAARDRAFT_47435 [Jaapia argillacea MUCL 33604]